MSSDEDEPAKNRKWMKLANIPGRITNGDVVKINNNEFLFVPIFERQSYKELMKAWGIYKYNMTQNEWTEFIKYPNEFNSYGHRVTFNKTTNKLYMWSEENDLWIIDIKTNKFAVKHGSNNLSFPDAPRCNMVTAKDTVHLIGGWSSSEHLIWKEQTETFQVITKLDEYPLIDLAAATYVPFTQNILLCGGFCESQMIKNIWKYSLKSATWNKIENVMYSMYDPRIVATTDGKYAFIAGGWDSGYLDSNELFILDMSNDDNKYELKQSTLDLPDGGSCHLIITGNETMDNLIVFGFVRQMFNTTEFEGICMPPICIVQLIGDCYVTEILHWMKRDGKHNHFAIPVQLVLQSIQENAECLSEETC